MFGKKPSGINKQAAPSVAVTKAERTAVTGDKQQEQATPVGPRRHRMAGSHDGMYVTEHHRGKRKA